MKTKRILTVFAVLESLIALATYNVTAYAEDFQSGEPVGFHYDGTWHVGSVVAVEGGRIKIRAESNGRPTEVVFPVMQVVRPAGTSGYRTWSYGTTAFRVKAALIDVNATSLRLRKPDGDEFTVPTANLSQPDQEFATKMRLVKEHYLASNLPSVSATPPSPSELGAQPRMGTAISRSVSASPKITGSSLQPTSFGPVVLDDPQVVIRLDASADSVIECADKARDRDLNWDGAIREPLVIGSASEAFNLPETNIRYPRVMTEEFAGIVPLGGDEGWCLCSVATRPGLDRDAESALRWISLQSKTVSDPVPIVAGETLYDYQSLTEHVLTASIPRRSLAFAGVEIPDHWSIYKLPPGATGPKLIARIEPSGWSHSPTGSPWAKLLPDARAILNLPERLVLVDYRAGTLLMEIRLPRAGSLPFDPRISPDQRYLLFNFRSPRKYRMIVDLQTRKVVHLSRVSSENVNADNFSYDGRHLITATQDRLVWYDLQSWKMTRSETLSVDMGTEDFHMLSDRYALSSVGGILDFKYGRSDVRTGIFPDRMANVTRDTRLFHDRVLIGDRVNSEFNCFACVRLPGDTIEKFLEKVASSPQFKKLQRGDSVRLELPEVGSDQVQEVFQAICEQNGWKISPDSEFVLAANETIHGGLRRWRDSGLRYQFRISVSVDERVLWSSRGAHLVVTPDSVTYEGAVYGDQAIDAIPPGLEIPETLIDFRNQDGTGFTSYYIKDLARRETSISP